MKHVIKNKSNSSLQVAYERAFAHNKLNKKIRKSLVYLIVMAVMATVSLVLLLFYSKADDTGKRIIEGVWISFIASLILFLLTEHVFKDNTQVNQIQRNIEDIKKTIIVSEDIKRYGIQSIKNISYEDDSDLFWIDLLKSTHEGLYIMAHSLSPWFQEKYEHIFFGTIKRLVSSEKDVRIVILRPSGYNLKTMNLGNVEDYSNKLRYTISRLMTFLDTLETSERNHFQVKLNGVFSMPYTYIRNEKQVLISPYFFSGRERSNFMISFDANSVFSDSFNNDYNELFENSALVPLTELSLIEKIESKMNQYSASNWKYEDTYKYIFSNATALYEVGYYIHYDINKAIVDRTIELPSSFGCPFKCKYCASSSISSFQLLKEEEITSIVHTVFRMHNLSREAVVHITFTGTGDLFYTKETVLSSINALVSCYPRTVYTVSSCSWNEELIDYVEKSGLSSYFKHLQMTFVSSNIDTVKKLIPNYIERSSIKSLISHIKNSELNTSFRVNYLMIHEVNDRDEDFDLFISTFSELKDIITVRISRLNETSNSCKNRIEPAPFNRLQTFCSMCRDHGFNAYIFSSEKNDNMNCGQLITERKY